MMNAFCQAKLVDASLQTTFQEVFHLESQHIIQLHTSFVKYTDTDKAANERIAFEETLRVFLVEGQKLAVMGLLLSKIPDQSKEFVIPCRATNFRQRQHDPPDLPLITKAILSHHLKFAVPDIGQQRVMT